jgi:ketosteroid isomerase-like protein
MSTNREELIRDFYEAWNREGPQVLRRFAAEDVELRDAPELPDSRVWRGREQVERRLEEVAAHVGGGWVELTEVRPIEAKVLVRMDWRLEASERGASVGEVFHVVELDQGEITSIDVFLTEGDAVEAAGSG